MFCDQMYWLGAKRNGIRELFEYGRSRAAEVGPENVYDYSLGNPSIPAPRIVEDTLVDLIRNTDPLQIHGYTSSIGALPARQAIADDLNQRYQAGIRPENLFLTCGAAAGLMATLRALSCFEGAEVVAIAPYFPEYRPFSQVCGLNFVTVPADMAHFQIRFDELERCLNSKTQAVFINSPNNPSGTVYTRQTLERLAQLLTAKGKEFGHPIYIIADEPYRELVYDGAEVTFIPNVYPNTIVCYSYSKSLSLPGERIGYVCVPDQAQDSHDLYLAIAGAARACGQVCAPSLMQQMIARCAGARPDLEAYDRNRKLLYRGLVEMGYTVAKPDGAFYLFVKAPNGSSHEFSELAKTKNLILVPGDDFGCPEYFRLCYCVDHDMIARSLPIFRELISNS